MNESTKENVIPARAVAQKHARFEKWPTEGFIPFVQLKFFFRTRKQKFGLN